MEFYKDFNEMFDAQNNIKGDIPIFNISVDISDRDDYDDIVSAFVDWVTDEDNESEVWEFCKAWNLVDEVLDSAGVVHSAQYFDGTEIDYENDDEAEEYKADFIIEVTANEEWAESWAEQDDILEDWAIEHYDGYEK